MKKIARCYGVWTYPYYRTEDGHTFSINDTVFGKVVCYYGNAVTGHETIKILDEAEKKTLFDRVEFVN